MGRGAQSGGTKVLWMRLRRNGAAANHVGAWTDAVVNRTRTGKRKRDSPKRIAFVEAMKSTA
jgi:hypothetical protein